MTTLIEPSTSVSNLEDIIQLDTVRILDDALDCAYTTQFETPIGVVTATCFTDETGAVYGINLLSGDYLYMAGFGAYGPCEESVRPINRPHEIMTRAGHSTFQLKGNVLDPEEVEARFGIRHPYSPQFPLDELITRASTLKP